MKKQLLILLLIGINLQACVCCDDNKCMELCIKQISYTAFKNGILSSYCVKELNCCQCYNPVDFSPFNKCDVQKKLDLFNIRIIPRVSNYNSSLF